MSRGTKEMKHVCERELGKEDFLDIWKRASSLSDRWDSLGLMLCLSPNVIKSIEADYPRNSLKCLREVFTRWLEKGYDYKRYGHPSWRMLCIAIKSSSGGNDTALAEELAREHPASADHSEAEARSPLATASERIKPQSDEIVFVKKVVQPPTPTRGQLEIGREHTVTPDSVGGARSPLATSSEGRPEVSDCRNVLLSIAIVSNNFTRKDLDFPIS